jgi:formate hydrogenlyase subunit 3/multisubunit Na+/H+ antiporter MnhD subunit
MNWLLAAGLVALLAGGVFDIAVGVSRAAARVAPYVLAFVAAVLFGIVGALGVSGRPGRLGLETILGDGPMSFGPTGLVIDRLSGLFLLLTAVTAVPVCLVCAAWAARPERIIHRGLGGACCLTIGAVALIITADNVFGFVLAWELLTIGFYLLAGFNRADARHAGDSLSTVVFGKLSGAAVLLGFLLLAGAAHEFTFTALATLPRSPLRDAGFALLVAGFAVKVGLVPVHVWMPRGYQAAPGPLRAIMAGVAVNVGFYGMWRTLETLRVPPGWLAVAVLLIGAITALLGIAHATTHTNLAGVIAYSSVENGGLISVGYGVALIGAAISQPGLTAVGLMAATLQMVAHAFGKSLLFTATAGIEDATGTTELEALRGIAHRVPINAAGLAIGSLTLAGLPLTVGFVSEWFLLESLMQQFRVGHLPYALPMALAGALVALTVGFAAVAFVRVIGLIVLGPLPHHRTDNTAIRRGGDAGWVTAPALALLGIGCIGLAAIGPLWIRVLAAGLSPITPAGISDGSLKSPWVLQPVYAEFSALSPTWLSVTMPTLFVLVLAGTAVLSGGRMFTVRRVPAWRSATDGVTGDSHYTPFGFANPTRKVLATILLTSAELTVLERGPAGSPMSGTESSIAGRDNADLSDRPADHTGQQNSRPRPGWAQPADPGGFVRAGQPPPAEPAHAHLGYTTDVVEVFEHYLFTPLERLLTKTVRTAKIMQNGRLDAYLAYMLLAVMAVLAIAAGLV